MGTLVKTSTEVYVYTVGVYVPVSIDTGNVSDSYTFLRDSGDSATLP